MMVVFTRNIPKNEVIMNPSAHAEGKFLFHKEKEKDYLARLIDNDQLVFRYVDKKGEPEGYPYNPNGSLYDIAGICDLSGRIFGLMPHPEAYNHFTNHPDWTHRGEKLKRQKMSIDPGPTLGVRIFQNAVDFVRRL